MLHRLHFIHDERVSAAPGIRSILRRLSPRTRAEARAVGHVLDEGNGAGTGFLVKAPGKSGLAWVMTNAHVVKHETNASKLEVRFEDAGRGWTGRVRRALFFDRSVDAALLEVELPKLPGSFKAATLLDRPVRAGEALQVIGFPGVRIVKDDKVRRRIIAAPAGASFPRPSLKTIALGHENAFGAVQMIRGASQSRSIPVISAETVTLPGSSGSPVFAARGGVVALHALATTISDSLSKPGGVPESHEVPMERVLARIRQVRPELVRELTLSR
jgi:S1-C subfamily serine protease